MEEIIARLRESSENEDVEEADLALKAALAASESPPQEGTPGTWLLVAELAKELAPLGDRTRESARQVLACISRLARGWPEADRRRALFAQFDVLADDVVGRNLTEDGARLLDETAIELLAMPSVVGSTADRAAVLSLQARALSQLATVHGDADAASRALSGRREIVALLAREDLPVHWRRAVHVAEAKLKLAETAWDLRDILPPSHDELQALAWEAAEQLEAVAPVSSERAFRLLQELETLTGGGTRPTTSTRS